MDAGAELSTDKRENSSCGNYLDLKFEGQKHGNLMVSDQILNNSCEHINLPPPLPGVFVFDPPNKNSTQSLTGSNYSPLVTSSYDNNFQTAGNNKQPDSITYQKLKCPELNPSQEVNTSQKYFDSQAINVYGYQSPEKTMPCKLFSTITNEVDSMLPSEGNFYQSLQPVSINAFDTSPYPEQKIYQQLEPVSSEDYRVDMENLLEKKIYQELNPLSRKDCKIPKKEKKTYQQLRSVPDLNFIGGQSDLNRVVSMAKKKPEIPPEYATSKLYQQLSKPPKKQVRRSHPPDFKTYHQLRPVGYAERPQENLSMSLGQLQHVTNSRAFVTSTNPNRHHFLQDKVDYPQPNAVFKNNEDAFRYNNDPNSVSSSRNALTVPSFQSNKEPLQRGFQEHKPKVYLELRNPGLKRHKYDVPSESMDRHFSMDVTHHKLSLSKSGDNVSKYQDYQNVGSFDLQTDGKQSNIMLPGPNEFKLLQSKITDECIIPSASGGNDYKASQIQEVELIQNVISNQQFSSLNKATSKNVSSSVQVNEVFDRNLGTRSPQKVHYSVPNESNTDKTNESFKQVAYEIEKNQLFTQLANTIPTGVSVLENQTFISQSSDSNFLHSSSSVIENKTVKNLSSFNDTLVAKNNNSSYISDNRTSEEVKQTSYEKASSVEIESRTVDLQRMTRFSEEITPFSLDLNSDRNMHSLEHSFSNSSSIVDLPQTNSENNIILHQKCKHTKSLDIFANNEAYDNYNKTLDRESSSNVEKLVEEENNSCQKEKKDFTNLTVIRHVSFGVTNEIFQENSFDSRKESVTKCLLTTNMQLSNSENLTSNQNLTEQTSGFEDNVNKILTDSLSDSDASQQKSSDVGFTKNSLLSEDNKIIYFKSSMSSEQLENPGKIQTEDILTVKGPIESLPLSINEATTECLKGSSSNDLLQSSYEVKPEFQLKCGSKCKEDNVQANKDSFKTELTNRTHSGKPEIYVGTVEKEKGIFNSQSENFSSYQNTSFLTKKNRILCKTQKSEDTKCTLERPIVSTSNFGLSKKDLLSKETSPCQETNISSESLKISTLELAASEENNRVTNTKSKRVVSNSTINSANLDISIKNNYNLGDMSLKTDEKNLSESPNADKLEASFQSELQPTSTNKLMHLPKKQNVSPRNVSQNNSNARKRQSEERTQTETNVPDSLNKVTDKHLFILEKQHNLIKRSKTVPKKRKLLQPDNGCNRSKKFSCKMEEMVLDKLHKLKEDSSGSESCSLGSVKSENGTEGKKRAVFCQSEIKSQSTAVSQNQSENDLEVPSSDSKELKVNFRRSNIFNAETMISVKNSESGLKSSNLEGVKSVKKQGLTDKLLASNDKIDKLNFKKFDVKCHSEKAKKRDENELMSVHNAEDKKHPKRKVKYRKTKKSEVLSALRKTEPLLRSKYSKRIIKKKKLEYEPIEPKKKSKILMKRKYTKHKKQPLTKDDNENITESVKKSPPMSFDREYKLVDPLEEGLLSEDEDEPVFLGFDSPQEDDEDVLGFDFKAEPEDESLEPINAFLQQLDADCVTVECDPRSLLQAPSLTLQCSQCVKTLDSHQELVEHLQWHAARQHKHSHGCSVCSREFGTRAQLDKHIKWNHEGGKRFSCPVCHKRFVTGNYIQKHLATVHGRTEVEQKHTCPECPCSFTTVKKLKKHEEKCHEKTLYQCDKCLKNFLKATNLERHKLSHKGEGKKFPCAYCSEKFDSRALLHAHWPVHMEKKLFTCEICNKIFTALPSLKRHKILHIGEKLFRCEICQKSFTLLSTLKTHLLVHSGVKRFQCKLCDKFFNRQDVLNAHQSIHTGEKNFECDICSQKFRWRHAVKSHKLIYHSTEKPYVCEVCGKRFSHPESFKKHGEVHAEKMFYCQICLKAFSRPSSLKTHILIHTDLKQFVCDLCNKAFRHKSHLQKHFLVHTSEKPWLCKFCNRMYKDRNQLRRHKRMVHCKSFFKKVLPEVPENLKTMENFEMLTGSETAFQGSEDNSQENTVQDSENLISQSKHFILSNSEKSLSNFEDNSASDHLESSTSDLVKNNISSNSV